MPEKHSQDLDQDPDPGPGPDRAGHRFVSVWPQARPLLQLVELLAAGQHKGLHLTAQALLVLGDLAVVMLASNHR